jgi:hypothetical protein
LRTAGVDQGLRPPLGKLSVVGQDGRSEERKFDLGPEFRWTEIQIRKKVVSAFQQRQVTPKRFGFPCKKCRVMLC